MKKLIALAVLSLLSLSKADTLVYKVVENARQIGQGKDFRTVRSGFLAFDDTGTNAVAVLIWNSAGTKYLGIQSNSFTLTESVGKNNWTALRGYSVLTNAVGETYALLYGQNALLTTTKWGSLASAPRSLMGKVQEVATVNGDPIIWDATVTCVFDSRNTFAVNAANQTIYDFAAALRGKYLLLGYRQTDPIN